jgi:ABC-type antimicrobial peptide transport system permease subunit
MAIEVDCRRSQRQQRTREIGIRIAVGAHPALVARMFLASGVLVLCDSFGSFTLGILP